MTRPVTVPPAGEGGPPDLGDDSRRRRRENVGVGVEKRAATVVRRLAGTREWPLAAGAFLGAIAMVEVLLRGVDRNDSYLAVSMLLALAVTMPLAFAMGYPALAALTASGAAFATLATRRPIPAAGLVALLAILYLLGSRRSVLLSALVIVPFAVNAIVFPFDRGRGPRLFAVLLLVLVFGAMALGRIQRTRAETAVRDASERAIADTLVEHAARGERARIARELHDVVAHHISMISVQAETARLTTPGMPVEGANRLAAIGDTARTALTEMRRLLGVLREDSGTVPTRRPQPSLQQLNELIDDARDSAGASTRLIVHGAVVPLDPGVELTAYRIVQEALTNARRHAPGAAVDVELDYTVDALRLRIRDNGPGPQGGTGTGHGVLGMRERVSMAGGTLWTGPAPVGGFLVEAVLPIARRVE